MLYITYIEKEFFIGISSWKIFWYVISRATHLVALANIILFPYWLTLILYCSSFFTKLSEDDKAKLTDVGTSKAEADIRGTLAETPLYMAPEVTRFDIYEFSADIYSLGIMLWEMWYGQQVFSSVPVLSIQDLFAKVQDGLRPEHVPSYFPPSPAWKGLMEWCWSQDPKERPNAQQCNEAITRMIIPLPT